MEYRIVEKPSFAVVGKAIRVPTKDGENFRKIPQFWTECLEDGSYARLASMATDGGVLGNVTLGICTEFAANMEEFTYMVAAEGTADAVPEGMVLKTVPARTWAIFPGSGPMPGAIQAVWGYIWSDFFPANEWGHADGPDLEIYPPGDSTQADYGFEVWVPVIKK